MIDSSVSGIGGCPYANGASGNVATEDVLYLCELLGIKHSIDVNKLIGVGIFISKTIHKINLSSVTQNDFD